MSVTATIAGTLTVAETLGNNTESALAANRIVTHNQFNQSATLTSATTPPATIVAAWEQALTDGAVTIDLMAMTGTNGASTSASGLKVQAILLKNKTGNANSMTIVVGASNGYELSGADFSVTLQPGQWVVLYGNDATPDVAAGDKTLDVTGTGVQVLQIEVIAG